LASSVLLILERSPAIDIALGKNSNARLTYRVVYHFVVIFQNVPAGQYLFPKFGSLKDPIYIATGF
jgi:hypothetical protein